MSETAILELSKNATLLGLLLVVVVLTYKQLLPWLRTYLENQAKTLTEIAAAVGAMQIHQSQVETRLGSIEDDLGEIKEENAAIYTKLDMERKPRARNKPRAHTQETAG